MRRAIIFILAALMAATLGSAALAGTGVKFETEGLDKYSAGGVDLELGLPGIPLRTFVEVLGWWAQNDDQVTHVQAGVGARFYLFAPSSGLFAEGRYRYIVPLDDTLEPSTSILAGLGFRLRPVIGGIDVYAATTLTDHDILPKYLVGARIGF